MFKIIYHYLVVQKDIPSLLTEWKQNISRAIEERLKIHPDLYGKPLRRSLKGYRKLRVGDYRVIFRIKKDMVKIIIIQHRRVVYEEAHKRA